jgi:dolichyl-diphosphooligosaccharide--protein glycosyltransferase
MRQAEIGRKNFKLSRYTEAFTSEKWIVRIYKLNPPDNRGKSMTPIVKHEPKGKLKDFGLSRDKMSRQK